MRTRTGKTRVFCGRRFLLATAAVAALAAMAPASALAALDDLTTNLTSVDATVNRRDVDRLGAHVAGDTGGGEHDSGERDAVHAVSRATGHDPARPGCCSRSPTDEAARAGDCAGREDDERGREDDGARREHRPVDGRPRRPAGSTGCRAGRHDRAASHAASRKYRAAGVTPVVTTVQQATAPVLTTMQQTAAPVVATVAQVAAPAVAVVSPLVQQTTEAATQVVAPLLETTQQALDPVVTTAQQAVTPLTGRAAQHDAPLTGPVQDAATPTPEQGSVGGPTQQPGVAEPARVNPAPTTDDVTVTARPAAGAAAHTRGGAGNGSFGSPRAPQTGFVASFTPESAVHETPATRHSSASPVRAPGPFAPGKPSGFSATPGAGGGSIFVPLFAVIAAMLLLAAQGVGRRLRPTLAPPRLPILALSLERPG